MIKLTNHAVDTVELGSKQVGVGGLVLGRRSANEGLDRSHGGDCVPSLVQDTVLNGSSRVRAVLGRSNAAIHTSQWLSHRYTEIATHMIRKVTMLIHTAMLQNQPRCLRDRM